MNKKIAKQIGSFAIAGLLAFGAVGCGKLSLKVMKLRMMSQQRL